MKGYEKLIVWQKSMDLVNVVYTITKQLPEDERFGLYSQMRRAAVSIPSNIAEGHSRASGKEFARFLSIAQGSKAELETQLHICDRVGLIMHQDVDTALRLCSETGRMLTSLMNKLPSK